MTPLVEYILQLKYTALRGKSIISLPASIGNRVGYVVSFAHSCSGLRLDHNLVKK